MDIDGYFNPCSYQRDFHYTVNVVELRTWLSCICFNGKRSSFFSIVIRSQHFQRFRIRRFWAEKGNAELQSS